MFVCLSVRYRFSRQPLNRLLWNLAEVFDILSERQLSILVPNGCIINDLWHKLCIFEGGQSMTSDRYKKPKLRRHNALVSFPFSSDVIRLYLTSNMTGDTDGPKWRTVDGEQRPFLTGFTASLYIITQCVSVRYHFSRQPLNHLLWNLAGVFDTVSERQLSILVTNGCIISDLLHKLRVGRSVTSDR